MGGKIKRAVAEHYGISMNNLTSARRTWDVVRPRQVAMYLAKELTPMSLPQIGRLFGGRDHTTVLHAIRQIDAMRWTDWSIGRSVELLLAQLKSQDEQQEAADAAIGASHHDQHDLDHPRP
jgi:chromosomal replication initiator protein